MQLCGLYSALRRAVRGLRGLLAKVSVACDRGVISHEGWECMHRNVMSFRISRAEGKGDSPKLRQAGLRPGVGDAGSEAVDM